MTQEEVKKYEEGVDKLAELLHMWYLDATKQLDPENYNPDAQKEYKDLNEQQKFIDRFIAMKVIALFKAKEGKK